MTNTKDTLKDRKKLSLLETVLSVLATPSLLSLKYRPRSRYHRH